MMIQTIFPEEIDLQESETKLPKELSKEISMLYKLGVKDYEIKLLLNQKIKNLD